MERDYVDGFKNHVIRTLGLEGSWTWAKEQLYKGKMVRCKHWSGTLKYRIDSSDNTLLQCTYSKEQPYKWETSNHFLTNELFTDYVVVE